MTERWYAVLFGLTFLLTLTLAGLLSLFVSNVLDIHWWWLPWMLGHTVGGVMHEWFDRMLR